MKILPSLQETGEHVLVAAGEVHLERCVADLKERFSSQIENLIVSEPIIPFQETIIPKPKLDRLNEAIDFSAANENSTVDNQVITIRTRNQKCQFRIRAFPLTEEIVKCVMNHEKLLTETETLLKRKNQENSAISDDNRNDSSTNLMLRSAKDVLLDEMKREDFKKFRKELLALFESAWRTWRTDSKTFWGQAQDVGTIIGLVDRIWSFGPKKAKRNILFNTDPDYESRPSVWETFLGSSSDNPDFEKRYREMDQNVISGFLLSCQAGPLCEEPMSGVGFAVSEWKTDCEPGGGGDQSFGPLSGQIITTVKEGCRRAFQAQPQRLLAAMYSCVIQTNADVLGKVYAVLSRRGGRVLGEEMNEGTNLFRIEATLPVVDSFGFADELRKKTSGLASPQLVFSHWEVGLIPRSYDRAAISCPSEPRLIRKYGFRHA